MAKLYTTGPAHLFVGVGNVSSKEPVYLGTAETAPDIDIQREYEGVPNDLGGSRLPMDRIYEGEEGMVGGVLTRWNEEVIAALMSVPDFENGTRGLNNQFDLGTLMGSEGFAFPVWVVFPYASKPAFAGMPAGYRFWSCINMSEGIRPGTRAKRHQVLFKAQRSFTTSSTPSVPYSVQNGVGITAATWRLYDHDMSGLPDID